MTDALTAMRDECQQLMKSKNITQADLIRRISSKGEYTVTPAEMCNSLGGVLNSPKAKTIVADVYAILTQPQE